MIVAGFRGRRIDADHLVSERRQVGAVPTCTARGVECQAEREAVENVAHDRLFQLEQLVARLVVGRSPEGVSLAVVIGLAATPSPNSSAESRSARISLKRA
jgi:hypothetical protein